MGLQHLTVKAKWGKKNLLFHCPADTLDPLFQSGTRQFFSDLILERQIKIWFLSLYLRIANEKKTNNLF